MPHDLPPSPHPSREARYLFGYLRRRGGSLRLAPLLRGLAMDARAFADAVNDLNERYWITIVWRKAPPTAPQDLPDAEPRPLADVHRLCTTRFGRHKHRATWPSD